MHKTVPGCYGMYGKYNLHHTHHKREHVIKRMYNALKSWHYKHTKRNRTNVR